LGKGPFALSIQEFPQTILAITKGKRGMNTPLREGPRDPVRFKPETF
jgi:hypothetical protein